MVINEEKYNKYIKLTPILYDRCIEYMLRRGLRESTKINYVKELDSMFKNEVLTQTLYNATYSKKGYYPSVLKLITNTCDHFDLPNFKYKIIKPIKKKIHNPIVFTESEITRMIDKVEEYSLLMACSYYIGAGLRFSSAIMLSWNDFLWEDWIADKTRTGKCNIKAKGDKDAVLVVDPILMNRLYNLAERTGNMFMGIPYKNSAKDLYLFIKKIDLEALQDVYKKQNFENILDSKKEQVNVKERAKVEMIRKKHYIVDYKLRKLSTFFNSRHIKFHSLRHSRATNLLKKGFKLMTIKEQLMHQSISTTEIYLNLSNVDIEDEFNEKL